MDNAVKIMLVDDEAIVGLRLKPILEKSGYIVETFTDGKKAFERLQEIPFDIVVTDLKMPNIDGMELFQYTRERWPATRVIIITGFATVKTAKEALQGGVFDFIAKPFKISHLREVIEKAAEAIRQSC